MYDPNMRVLVVDDIQVMRSHILNMLRDLKIINTSQASDGKQALDLLKILEFDLIISDWNMPNVNGLELLQTVRKDKHNKLIPFLMVTAENKKEYIIEAIKAGVNNYIGKPFTAETLKKKLNEIFK